MVKSQGFKQAPSPCTLQGWGVRLEPLAPTHAEGLTTAARDGELWNLRVTSVPEPDQTANYIQLALDAKSQQRTHVNTACKLLLLTHAFEVLGAGVVGWRTDNFNYASQRAIERLGAKRDGAIRHHALRRDGTVRDTVMYSVIAGEWPEVRDHLTYQLKRHAR